MDGPLQLAGLGSEILSRLQPQLPLQPSNLGFHLVKGKPALYLFALSSEMRQQARQYVVDAVVASDCQPVVWALGAGLGRDGSSAHE